MFPFLTVIHPIVVYGALTFIFLLIAFAHLCIKYTQLAGTIKIRYILLLAIVDSLLLLALLWWLPDLLVPNQIASVTRPLTVPPPTPTPTNRYGTMTLSVVGVLYLLLSGPANGYLVYRKAKPIDSYSKAVIFIVKVLKMSLGAPFLVFGSLTLWLLSIP